MAGQLPAGGVRDVAVVDSLAYVVDQYPLTPLDTTFRVIDVSDPTAPAEIGSLDVGRRPLAVAVHLGLAYVVDGGSSFDVPSSLRVIDVADPTAPVEVGALDIGPGFSLLGGSDIALAGGRAYVVTSGGSAGPRSGGSAGPRLFVIDVSDPAAPAEIANAGIDGFAGERVGIAVVGGLAYVAANRSGLRVIDVSVPEAPVEIGRSDAPVSANDVEVAAGLAYVADGGLLDSATGFSSQSGLRVIDVSNPAEAVEIGYLNTPVSANGVSVSDGLAYVAAGHTLVRSGLRVIDVSNPATPSELTSIDSSRPAESIAVAGGLGFLAAGSLDIIDLSILEFPAEIGRLGSSEPLVSVVVEDDLAYVGTSSSGIRIIDVSTPTAPTELGAYETAWVVRDLEVSGGLAYVATDASGLRIVDVSNPAVPNELGSHATAGPARDVEVVDGIAYVVGNAVLWIIDVSNPAAPSELATLPLADHPQNHRALAVSEGRAYVTSFVDVELPSPRPRPGRPFVGIQVIDVSDPAVPVEVGPEVGIIPAFPDRFVTDIAVVDGLAYVASTDIRGISGLLIIDASDPEVPVLLGAVGMRGFGADVEVVDSLAYVATANGGLWVIDISNPSAPRALGGFSGFIGSAEGVAVAGRLAYVADFGVEELGIPAGLSVVDLGREYVQALTVDIGIKPGGDRNPINPKSRGVIPVVILGSETFDVADVDVTTLAFGPGGAPLAHRRGPHPKDENRDGVEDLLVHFRTQESGIAFGETGACVTGELIDGTPFEGCDSVRTVPGSHGHRGR